MRFLSATVVAGLLLAAAGCGLDANGLGSEDGGEPVTEAAAPPFDGTVAGEGGADVTPPPVDTGTEDAAGEDSAPGDDAPADGPSDDGGTDTGVDSGPDSGFDSGPDSGFDAGLDAGPDASDAGADSAPVDAGEDAADSACPGTCTIAALPSGWSVVEFEDTAGTAPPCSAGYGSPLAIVEGPMGAPATCGCACDLTTPGTCMTGDFSVNTDILGGGSCLAPTVTGPVNDGGCSPATENYQPSGNPKMKVDPAPYAPGACTPVPSVSTTPVTFTAQGTICEPLDGGAPAGTCPSGGTCATTPVGFSLCIRHDGTTTCPSGFTLPAHVVAKVGSVSDTRGCTTCSCGTADAGCAGQLTLFTDTACTQSPESVPVDDVCNSFPGPNGFGGPTYTAYEYDAAAQGEGCPPSPVAADGGVALTNTHTVCCQ